MVNRLRLNEKSVRAAEPAKGRDYQIFDTEVRGFAVCVYRSGSRAFTIDYRHAGRQRRMTIGRWPEWSTTAARERAKDLRREIDAGGDPLGQKETGRDAPRIKDLIDRYTEVHLPHLAALNAADQKSMLAKMVAPDWGNKLVTEITPYDVEKLLNKVAAGRARPSKEKPNNRARKLYTHEDAEVIAATVAGMPHSLGGIRMAIQVAELARAGLTPDWMPGVVPRCVPLETKHNQHGERATTIIVGTERVKTRGKWRTVDVLACPVTWRPHPEQIASGRRGYEDWWQALGWVRAGLIAGGMMRDVELTRAMPRERPWRKRE